VEGGGKPSTDIGGKKRRVALISPNLKISRHRGPRVYRWGQKEKGMGGKTLDTSPPGGVKKNVGTDTIAGKGQVAKTCGKTSSQNEMNGVGGGGGYRKKKTGEEGTERERGENVFVSREFPRKG